MEMGRLTVAVRAHVRSAASSLVGVALLMVCATIVVLALLGSAVGNVSSNVLDSYVMTSDSSVGNAGFAAAQVPAKVPSRVILREGYVTLIVEDTHATMDAIRGIVADMESQGAFIVTSQESLDAGSQTPTASMAIRVPAGYRGFRGGYRRLTESVPL